jgi:hypothetical protein
MDETVFFLLLFTLPAVVILLPQWLRSRERHRLIAAVATAAERGHVLPAEIIERILQPPTRAVPLLPQPERDHRRGVLFLATALGIGCIGIVVFAIGGMAGSPDQGAMAGLGVAGAGAIPALIGLAYLMLSRRPRS